MGDAPPNVGRRPTIEDSRTAREARPERRRSPSRRRRKRSASRSSSPTKSKKEKGFRSTQVMPLQSAMALRKAQARSDTGNIEAAMSMNPLFKGPGGAQRALPAIAAG